MINFNYKSCRVSDEIVPHNIYEFVRWDISHFPKIYQEFYEHTTRNRPRIIFENPKEFRVTNSNGILEIHGEDTFRLKEKFKQKILKRPSLLREVFEKRDEVYRNYEKEFGNVNYHLSKGDVSSMQFEKFKQGFLNLSYYGLYYYFPFSILEDSIDKCYPELNEHEKKDKFSKIFNTFYTYENPLDLNIDKSFLDLCEKVHAKEDISLSEFAQEIRIFCRRGGNRWKVSNLENIEYVKSCLALYLDRYKTIDSIKREKESWKKNREEINSTKNKFFDELLGRAEHYNINRILVVNLLNGLSECAKSDEKESYLINKGFKLIEDLSTTLRLSEKCSSEDILNALKK